MDKDLAAFLAVARNSTLTDASNELGLTQPSVTKRIANLEQELGSRLFDRHRRGMNLSAAGEAFYARAEIIEREFRQGREEIAALSAAGLSVLRVGAGPLFHLRFAAGLFGVLKAKFPNLKLELTTDTKHPIGDLINNGELDVYMGIIPPEQLDDSIYIRPMADVEHGVVLRADHELAQQQKVDPSELDGFNWVIFSIDPETEKSIRDYCVPKAAIEPTIDVRTTSFATGLQLVQQGNFVMSAPLQLAQRIEAEGLVIRPTIQGMPKRQAGIYVRKSAIGFAAIQLMLEYSEGYSEQF